MRIAINAVGGGTKAYIELLLNTICAHHPQHEFLLFIDTNPGFTLPSNMHLHVVSPSVTSLLAKRWWLDVKLPSELKKCHANILLNITGDASLRTRLPQVLLVDDMIFIHQPKYLTSAEVLFRKFYLPKYAKTAKAIIVPSEQVKQEMMAYCKNPEEKVAVINALPHPAFQPMEWQDKENIKSEFTGGNEFFLFTGGFEPINDLITVLKAFSQFKKWQRSSMKLVITGNTTNSETAEKINTYKFREDVVLLNEIDVELPARLMAAAYAFIHTPLYDGSGRNVMEAMRSGTPVICSEFPSIASVAGDAALYITPGNEQTIATQMLKLYKDEELRSQLIAAGKVQAEGYYGNRYASALWGCIGHVLPEKK